MLMLTGLPPALRILIIHNPRRRKITRKYCCCAMMKAAAVGYMTENTPQTRTLNRRVEVLGTSTSVLVRRPARLAGAGPRSEIVLSQSRLMGVRRWDQGKPE
jgi:hypothetical protein